MGDDRERQEGSIAAAVVLTGQSGRTYIQDVELDGDEALKVGMRVEIAGLVSVSRDTARRA